MSATDSSFFEEATSKPSDWIRELEKYEENYYAIVRQFGSKNFEFILDDSGDDISCPMGYLGQGIVKDYPLWEANVFITSNKERLYRKWLKCEEDKTNHYRIVKLSLTTHNVNMEILEAQMKIAARDEVLSRLPEEDKKILMEAK